MTCAVTTLWGSCFACRGVWLGDFALRDEILWNPEDPGAPYSLIFDPRTWVKIKPLKAKRFHGFTYDVPDPGVVEPA